MTDPSDDAPRPDAPRDRDYRGDWDARAEKGMRFYVATWNSRSDADWAAGAERDAAFLMQRLPEACGPGQRCLDLGCGPGRLIPALAARFDAVVGCDVSPRMLDAARAALVGLENVRLELVDGRSLAPFDDDAFELVVASAVFIHLDPDTLRAYLAEVARVLAPGGLLAATFNSSEPPSAVPTDAAEPDGAPLPPLSPEQEALVGGDTWDGVRVTRAELEAALAGFGFEPRSIESEGDIWIVVAART